MCGLNEKNIQDIIKTSFLVIRKYDWLLDLYVLDFFVENHWSKLPEPWQNCFGTMDPADIGHILSGTSKSSHLLPLSFIALLKVLNLLSISRDVIIPEMYSGIGKKEAVRDIKCTPQSKLKKALLKHVKLKKRHEITTIAKLVHKITVEQKCEAVMDFGSGLGHLIRVLTYEYGLTTAGIECQLNLTSEARKMDRELEYTMKKHLSPECLSKRTPPLHINLNLSSKEQLTQLTLPKNMEQYGLIGLHPCGDLGPLLIKHFVESPHVKFICLVGCCYMKLSCGSSSESCEVGYPLSTYVNSLKEHKLSYASREIACHAIEMYCNRLKNDKYEELKVHAYRAALELLLVAVDPCLRHMQIGNTKHVSELSFEEYCSIALARTKVKLIDTTATQMAGALAIRDWRRVVVLYSLRLALAPLVETVLLLDRLLYLRENGLHCEIYPIFDPKISPRNHILTAHRL